MWKKQKCLHEQETKIYATGFSVKAIYLKAKMTGFC
jgi:hypothetical protein